jgi:hypothetical protein
MNNVEYLYYKYLNKYKSEIRHDKRLLVLKLIHIIYEVLFFVSLIFLLFGKRNSNIHYYILGVWVIIIFHWIILKGECIIDLIEKKILNKNYKTGDVIVFLMDFNYNLITKKIKKYNSDDISSYYIIKLLKLLLVGIALYKIDINIIYKILIFVICLFCLGVLFIWQIRQAKYINSLDKNNKIFQL